MLSNMLHWLHLLYFLTVDFQKKILFFKSFDDGSLMTGNMPQILHLTVLLDQTQARTSSLKSAFTLSIKIV
jgi:hypothetical protein